MMSIAAALTAFVAIAALSTLNVMHVAAASTNPFAGQTFFVNPTFQANIDATIAATTDAATVSNLKIARSAPSAYWLDVMSKVNPASTTLDTMNGIMLAASAAANAAPQLVVFIVYDLPNRDCAARASNGELCCVYNSDGTCNFLAKTDCSAGLSTYKTQYIDNIAAILKKYPKVPVVLVIEPDSLPNVVTNTANPQCGDATQTAYKQGVTYAVQQLSTFANVKLYLDAGHGMWLGWQNNAAAFKTLITSLGILSKIRGFATNVANYQPLGVACQKPLWCLPNAGHTADPCCADPCKAISQWNPATNELNYVLELDSLFPGKYYIIDTGRNGVPNARSDCANWCNPRNMGLGRYPTTATDSALVDAYFWLKTPGESDGCTQTLPSGGTCARFDSMCQSPDSIGSHSAETRMPEAGKWSTSQIQMLAQNANFGAVPAAPTPAPTPTTPTPTPVQPTGMFKCMMCVAI